MTALAALLALTAPVRAGDTHRTHPGYIEGSHFVELADPNGRLIEVTLHGKLLNLLCTRAIRRHDEQLADILDGLVSMQAVIAEFTAPEDAESAVHESTRQRAEHHVREVARQLERDGWERFVRVRESDREEYLAFVRINRQEEVDGLVVMGFTGGRELLFVNLAGTIDMDAVAVLGERFDVPGLDNLPDTREVRDRQAQSERERSNRVPERTQNDATLAP